MSAISANGHSRAKFAALAFSIQRENAVFFNKIAAPTPIYPGGLPAVQYCPPMQTAPPILKQHRVSRVILWAQTLLGWALLLLHSSTSPINRRHMRQRYGLLSLAGIERIVCALIVVRGVEMARVTGGSGRQRRDASPSGFRRRSRSAGIERATVGARLRAALRHRVLHEHIARLLAAFSDIDGYARRYFVARARRCMTRLWPILVVAPPTSACASLAAPAPCAVDSS